VPGSPAWEREIERAIRGAAGIIVLLSPDSNNSEWVRREISFAQQNDKQIFPVLIRGEEDDSVPLRLSNHQWVDLRTDSESGLDGLADALKDQLGVTVVNKKMGPQKQRDIQWSSNDLKKFALPGLLALIALACIGGLILLGSIIRKNIATPSATLTVTTAPDVDPILTATAGTSEPVADLFGKIVYTCQINKTNNSDQICLINADGTNQRQLTKSDDNQDASLSPDGQSVIFVSNQTGHYEIFETDLSGKSTRLTDLKSTLGVPEISPDNNWIVFTNRIDNFDQIWLMERNGKNAQMIFRSDGNAAVAPTWSPDGRQILFAVGKDLNRQLYIMGFDGRDPHLLSDQILTPGRTDWSPQNMIAYFIGDAWHREVWTMFSDGTGLVQVTDGGNAQSPSFSSGGRYIAFTAYTDVAGRDELSCEIFVMDLFSKEKWQLTKNEYCDYQPRWGN